MSGVKWWWWQIKLHAVAKIQLDAVTVSRRRGREGSRRGKGGQDEEGGKAGRGMGGTGGNRAYDSTMCVQGMSVTDTSRDVASEVRVASQMGRPARIHPRLESARGRPANGVAAGTCGGGLRMRWQRARGRLRSTYLNRVL